MVKGPLPTTPQDPCPPSPAVTICSVKTGMSGGVPCKERKGQALSPDPPGALGWRACSHWRGLTFSVRL